MQALRNYIYVRVFPVSYSGFKKVLQHYGKVFADLAYMRYK